MLDRNDVQTVCPNWALRRRAIGVLDRRFPQVADVQVRPEQGADSVADIVSVQRRRASRGMDAATGAVVAGAGAIFDVSPAIPSNPRRGDMTSITMGVRWL